MSDETRDQRRAAYERSVAYIEQALRLNPLNDSATVIRRRNRLLGLEAASPLASSTVAVAKGAPVRDVAAERQKLLALHFVGSTDLSLEVA